MHLYNTLFSLLALATTSTMAQLAHVPRHHQRPEFCGLWDKSASQNGFQVSNNLWGYGAGSGSQCTGVDAFHQKGVAWHTEWSWSGGDNSVKSFANVAKEIGTPKQLSAVHKMPSHFHWGYNNTEGISADVAYDLFTSSSPNGSEEFELMIWLGRWGQAKPISYSYNASGAAVPVATDVKVGKHSWNLFKGSNGQQIVYSFLPQNIIPLFKGDLKHFYNYLIQHQGYDKNQYLVSAQGGTEPFTGSGARFHAYFKLGIY